MDGRENIGMEDKKLFRISDVAKMFHVSAGAGFSQEITLIDDGMTSDSEKFVTEIRLPICTAMNR